MAATPNRKPSPAQAEFIRAIVSFGVAEVSAKHLFRPYGLCVVGVADVADRSGGGLGQVC